MIYNNGIKIYEKEEGVLVGTENYAFSKTLKIDIPSLFIDSNPSAEQKSSVGINTKKNLNPKFKVKSNITCVNYVEAVNITSIPSQFKFDLTNKYTLDGKSDGLANSNMAPMSHQREGPHPDHKHDLKTPFKIKEGVASKLYRDAVPAGTKVIVSFIRGDLDKPVVEFIYDVIK